MYGFVNQAIKELIESQYGSETWERVKTQAKVMDAHFLSDKTYDDKLTYDLVGAIAQELDISVPQTLEVFGEFWVSYLESQGFGALLKSNGSTFTEFLLNLDQFHSRLTTSYPKFVPPDFDCTELSDGRIELTYKSGRPGLFPMVAGIIRGLATRYEVEIELELEPNDSGASFLISMVSENEAVG